MCRAVSVFIRDLSTLRYATVREALTLGGGMPLFVGWEKPYFMASGGGGGGEARFALLLKFRLLGLAKSMAG